MIKVATVGAGYFSQFHHNSWERIADADLVGISDRNLHKIEKWGKRAYTDFAKMLQETQPDLVDVILPPAGHADAIRASLDAGVKAIICQKPFCNDLAEARAITELAKSVGVPIVVHENFRFQPWYRTIKSAIDSGKIGALLQTTFRLRPGDGQGREAYLDRQPYFQKMEKFLIHETAVHWVDTFRFLMGNPTSVYADLRRVNPVIAGEDAGYVIFEHPDGVRSIFDGNRSLDHSAENSRCTMGEGLFEGTAGTLTLNGDGSVDLREFGAQTKTQIHAPDTTGTFGGDCVHALQSHVVDALNGNGEFENLAQDYLTIIEIEDAIYLSSQKGCKIGFDNDASGRKQSSV